MNITLNRRLFFTVFFCLLTVFLFSQEIDELRKKQKAEIENLKMQREKEILLIQDDFKDYLKKHDKEFSEYLKSRWVEFELFKSKSFYTVPKPDKVPEFIPDNKSIKKTKKLPVETIKIDLNIKQLKQRFTSIALDSDKFSKNYITAKTTFDFFGNEIIIEYSNKIKQPRLNKINKDEISKWWDETSLTNYVNTLNQLIYYKDVLHLNDWAFYLFLRKFSESIYSNSSNEQKMLTWFLLLHSGYKAKIAYSGNNVLLLIPSVQTLYGKKYLIIDKNVYYIINESNFQYIYSYKDDYNSSGKLFDFNIYDPIILCSDIKTKEISFNYKNNIYPVKLVYNQNAINFFSKYPQVDLNVYFQAAISEPVLISFENNFKPILKNMNEKDAANFLLNFVQTSFKYKTDNENFGKEKFLFSEEVLFYPYSDCEDRAVLFAHLIQKLLGLKIIALEYPNHVATAINFNESITGDYIVFNAQKYIIADPTFINAPVGKVMPDYSNKPVKILPIKNFPYYKDQFVLTDSTVFKAEYGFSNQKLNQNINFTSQNDLSLFKNEIYKNLPELIVNSDEDVKIANRLLDIDLNTLYYNEGLYKMVHDNYLLAWYYLGKIKAKTEVLYNLSELNELEELKSRQALSEYQYEDTHSSSIHQNYDPRMLDQVFNKRRKFLSDLYYKYSFIYNNLLERVRIVSQQVTQYGINYFKENEIKKMPYQTTDNFNRGYADADGMSKKKYRLKRLGLKLNQFFDNAGGTSPVSNPAEAAAGFLKILSDTY